MANSATSAAFSFLPAPLAADLVSWSRTLWLRPNQTLFSAGDPADGCYWIHEGFLKVTVEGGEGEQRILAIIGPDSLVGEAAVLDAAPRSASVAAVQEARLAHVTRAAFDAFADRHPEAYRYIALLLMRRLRDIDDALAATTFLPLKGRVARALIVLADALGKDAGGGRVVINHKLNQSELAAMAGISRENVNRILKEWLAEGLITRNAGYYCVENRPELEKQVALSAPRSPEPRLSARPSGR